MNFLDQLFCRIEDRYGDAVAWTTMGAIADGLRGVADWRRVARPEPDAAVAAELPPQRAAAA